MSFQSNSLFSTTPSWSYWGIDPSDCSWDSPFSWGSRSWGRTRSGWIACRIACRFACLCLFLRYMPMQKICFSLVSTLFLAYLSWRKETVFPYGSRRFFSLSGSNRLLPCSILNKIMRTIFDYPQEDVALHEGIDIAFVQKNRNGPPYQHWCLFDLFWPDQSNYLHLLGQQKLLVLVRHLILHLLLLLFVVKVT